MRIALAVLITCVMMMAGSFHSFAKIPVVNGVSWELAEYRKKTISSVEYRISLNIPNDVDFPIKAMSEINFNLNDTSDDLQIDFNEDKDKISKIIVNGSRHEINHYNEHIVINKSFLRVGKNNVKIDYIAGNGALNRMPGYLYTLFVPDRMRTTFPSFDQPNLKATFELSLDIPRNWDAISSAKIRSRRDINTRAKLKFKKSDLISTYLFSFVTGRFNRVEKRVGNLQMTMLHREFDREKARRNVNEIFDLHKSAVEYMEEYTGIEFPFQKFAFALIPSFQFGGMEHVGAIQYKASTLMLEEGASSNERLSRAALIGHETAHMWFGDLVTMDWFNDVWTKEVFANFMSAKLVNPGFPEINHELRSHLNLHPRAYSVDRTEGPNPIRQVLPNLNEAGTMYGAIIYNKAPIMMQQLELLIGEEAFRDGIREYLNRFAFSNATWDDLINILDKKSDRDLKRWSEVWVNTPGRPTFTVSEELGKGLMLEQNDPLMLERRWPQSFDLRKGAVPYNVSYSNNAINLDDIGNSDDSKLLINSNGMGYGLFPITKEYIQDNWNELEDLERASAFVNLYEQLLEGNGVVSPIEYLDLIMWTMERENNPLIINHLMRQLVPTYWSLLNETDRKQLAPKLEEAMWRHVNSDTHDTGLKRIYFRSYADIVISKDALASLKEIWNGSVEIENLNLVARDYTNLAATLAIKLPNEAQFIIDAQERVIEGPDNQRRFVFIKYALSPDQEYRDEFFEQLTKVENRYTEPWVLSALNYLHHPLRRETSEKYITRSLEILQEIQITGDIFFPGRWLASTLRYYQSDTAVKQVRDFLNERPDYNNQLRMKILQEADKMFRANRILKANSTS